MLPLLTDNHSLMLCLLDLFGFLPSLLGHFTKDAKCLLLLKQTKKLDLNMLAPVLVLTVVLRRHFQLALNISSNSMVCPKAHQGFLVVVV